MSFGLPLLRLGRPCGTAPLLVLLTVLSGSLLEAQQRVQVCVVQNGSLRVVEGLVDAGTRDTLVEGRSFRVAHPAVGPNYVEAAEWFRLDTVSHQGVSYWKAGVPRVLRPDELTRLGELRGTPVFAATGSAGPTPAMIWVPVRPGCVFQGYQRRLVVARPIPPRNGAPVIAPPPPPPPPPPPGAPGVPDRPPSTIVPSAPPSPGEGPSPSLPAPGSGASPDMGEPIGSGEGAPTLTPTDQAIAEMPTGTIAFNTPERVPLHQTAQVQLVLGVQMESEELVLRIEGSGPVETHPVRVGDRMAARLVGGRGFDVQAITPEVQTITSIEPTEWRWNVTATRGGTQRLELTLDALIDVQGERVSRSIRTFSRTIEVEVSGRQRIMSFVEANWQWLWAAIVFPLLALGWQRLRRKKVGAD